MLQQHPSVCRAHARVKFIHMHTSHTRSVNFGVERQIQHSIYIESSTIHMSNVYAQQTKEYRTRIYRNDSSCCRLSFDSELLAMLEQTHEQRNNQRQKRTTQLWKL